MGTALDVQAIGEDEQDVWLRPGGEQRAKSEEKGQQKAFHDHLQLALIAKAMTAVAIAAFGTTRSYTFII